MIPQTSATVTCSAQNNYIWHNVLCIVYWIQTSFNVDSTPVFRWTVTVEFNDIRIIASQYLSNLFAQEMTTFQSWIDICQSRSNHRAPRKTFADINKKFWRILIAYFPLIWHGRHRNRKIERHTNTQRARCLAWRSHIHKKWGWTHKHTEGLLSSMAISYT
jgi:hypothetical protein